MSGRIFQISASRGGVPKLAVRSAVIEPNGIVVDKQRDTRHHGGPERALCLFALERIIALQQEGHPIFPGSTGENLTTIGIDPEQLVPGTKLRLGDAVVIELTSWTVPCQNITASFADENSTRISQKLFPGWSRIYARIIETGSIRTGDLITLLD